MCYAFCNYQNCLMETDSQFTLQSKMNSAGKGMFTMDAFPISGWLILILPPILMIGSVALWYAREVKMEKLENELFRKKHDDKGL